MCSITAWRNASVLISGAAVFVAQRDLALGVRPQPGQFARLAHRRLALHQLRGQPERVGHEIRCFVGGVAEHQPLVAGTDFAIGTVYPLIDVAGLKVEAHLHFAGIRVDARGGIGVAGFA
jgi:hypothetical protein